MARGIWDDFRSKSGFSDGETVEQRDFQARAKIIRRLNRLTPFKTEKVRAVAYDRPGVHNSCLIILFANPDGKSDEELLRLWLDHKIESTDLPGGEYEAHLSDIVEAAYD